MVRYLVEARRASRCCFSMARFSRCRIASVARMLRSFAALSGFARAEGRNWDCAILYWSWVIQIAPVEGLQGPACPAFRRLSRPVRHPCEREKRGDARRETPPVRSDWAGVGAGDR